MVHHSLFEVLHVNLVLFEQDVFNQEDLNSLNFVFFHLRLYKGEFKIFHRVKALLHDICKESDGQLFIFTKVFLNL